MIIILGLIIFLIDRFIKYKKEILINEVYQQLRHDYDIAKITLGVNHEKTKKLREEIKKHDFMFED